MKIEDIRQVAVLGLGTMGHGIAQTFAMAGYSVKAYDDVAAARASACDRIRQNLQDFVKAGLVAAKEVDPIVDRVKIVDREEEAVAGTQFVTEAVREDVAVKQELFGRLEAVVPDETILASNSSTFPISQSGAKMKRPERAIVTHWFNPPHIIPTVEVVPGPKTSKETAQTTLELMKRIGKEAILINREIPGFIVNRVQMALAREVWHLLDEGIASAEDIDAAVRGSMGFRLAAIGPLEVHDFGGLDITTTVYRNLAPDLRSDAALPGTVQALLDAGHHGAKTGRGFYPYSADILAEKRSRRDSRFLALLKLFYNRDRSG